ncbi:MAG TPA: RNA 2'-phosphotransferase, partial [bacterium]|nr:RNA 2'-phosphotransferase [bacterium]
MSNRRTRRSKYLSYVLRHNPQSIGIELDAAGWVAKDTLIAASRKQGKDISSEDISAIIRHSDKRRFTLSDDGKYIRANYGHSVDVDPGYEPKEPPEQLYHGTARRFVPTI